MSIGKRHNYKNLKIWQLALEIANNISDILLNFPMHEKYSLNSQISRCSISIPSNIAEGSARTDKSFSHFLDVSLGSSFELLTQLHITQHRNYINQELFNQLENKIEEFQRMTMAFQNNLK
ncbi:four helix bundle protein [Flavobacterium sp. xlx-214]|uniref:four helix bundle protein n=1 Tax=unclassified Flavobacterium TaxID=196869 RepID=UPI0015EEF760|nr:MULTISPECIES: four helix bundle protein [unclassified Flavobacterium]MBA5793182.1 four helix bundle protein [Flavobacterium sp. xlx-221]QMI82535.1 four helix bundle protein [Flavobacterium sp. xlx-214]